MFVRNANEIFFYFVDRASLYNLFQMKPTRCTLLLSIFISNSLHVSGNYMSIIRRTYCIYATLVFFTVYGWLSCLIPTSIYIILHDSFYLDIYSARYRDGQIRVSNSYKQGYLCPFKVQKVDIL